MTVRAADPCESALRIAAIEIALDDLLDNRPEIGHPGQRVLDRFPAWFYTSPRWAEGKLAIKTRVLTNTGNVEAKIPSNGLSLLISGRSS